MEDDKSFSVLFHQIQSGVVSTIVPDEDLANANLDRVFVGHSREEFSVVEIRQSVLRAFVQFLGHSSSSLCRALPSFWTI